MDRSIIQNFISGSLIGYTLFSLPTKREKAEDMRGREGGREKERFSHMVQDSALPDEVRFCLYGPFD